MDFSYLDHQDLMERKAAAFGNAGSLWDCRFEADNGKVPQMAHARQYARHWETMEANNFGLLLWGPPGCGKTFCAACIANALLERREFHRTVVMATLASILRRLLAQTPQEKEAYIQRLVSCDLLILDDLGMERQTEYVQEQVFSIIDGRYLSRRPMIITTNLSLHQMKHPASLPERRIYDRILELCVPVFFDGESLRAEKARDKMGKYKEFLESTRAASADIHPGA